MCAQRPAPMRACAKLDLPPLVQTCSPFSPGSTPPPCSTTATNVSARPCFVVHAFGGQRRALRDCRQQSDWEGNASLLERKGQEKQQGREDGGAAMAFPDGVQAEKSTQPVVRRVPRRQQWRRP